MIRVGRLKELLDQVPDEAVAYAYEGECVGIVIREGAPERLAWDSKKNQCKLIPAKGRSWFISAHEDSKQKFEERGHEGFEKKTKNKKACPACANATPSYFVGELCNLCAANPLISGKYKKGKR